MEITKEQYKKIKEQAEKYLEHWAKQDPSCTLPDVSSVIAVLKEQQF